MTTTTMAAPDQTMEPQRRFDPITIAFHWLTAVLVLALFASAVIWQQAPRDLGWRRPLESLHVSLGILMAAAVIGRILWRALAGRKLPPVQPGLQEFLSKAVHGLLYLLLIGQVVLGFTLRWFQGEEFSFFGLFSIPALVGTNDGLEHTIENLHNLTAWTIIYLVAAHAAAALMHHYWARDAVLTAMLPRFGERR